MARKLLVISCSFIFITVSCALQDPWDEYAETVLEIRRKSTGMPDETIGSRVANWRPGDGPSPDQWGPYYQGDILHPPRISVRNGLKDTSYRWPKAVVPFKINGKFTTAQLTRIVQAMEMFHKHTCVRFRPRVASRDEDYISIESYKAGCYSAVGRIGGRQILNLQARGCTALIGIPIHELMHVIGFHHEHSRSDRDTYVKIHWSNIERGDEHNFDKEAGTSAFRIPYDYGSIMHYARDDFSRNGKDTITPKKSTGGVILGQRETLSKRDIAKVNAMYKCEGAVSKLLL